MLLLLDLGPQRADLFIFLSQQLFGECAGGRACVSLQLLGRFGQSGVFLFQEFQLILLRLVGALQSLVFFLQEGYLLKLDEDLLENLDDVPIRGFFSGA